MFLFGNCPPPPAPLFARYFLYAVESALPRSQPPLAAVGRPPSIKVLSRVKISRANVGAAPTIALVQYSSHCAIPRDRSRLRLSEDTPLNAPVDPPPPASVEGRSHYSNWRSETRKRAQRRARWNFYSSRARDSGIPPRDASASTRGGEGPADRIRNCNGALARAESSSGSRSPRLASSR